MSLDMIFSVCGWWLGRWVLVKPRCLELRDALELDAVEDHGLVLDPAGRGSVVVGRGHLEEGLHIRSRKRIARERFRLERSRHSRDRREEHAVGDVGVRSEAEVEGCRA